MADQASAPDLKLWQWEARAPLETDFRKRKSVVIGRGIECDIVVKDPKASRRHCRITRKEAEYTLEDLNSKNGTFVDGQRITSQVQLKPNQTFKVGDTVFYLGS